MNRPDRMSWPARTFLLVLVVSAHIQMGACSEPPPSCPKLECAPAPACPAVTQFDAGNVASPPARLAVQTLQNMVNGKFELVRSTFTTALATELPATKLQSILDGLIRAHGAPLQIMDAWQSELKEKEERMPAAQVLLRMSNDTRVSLLLVFDAQGAVKGLWMRPI